MSSSNNSIHNLSNLISPKTAGIIWITDSYLKASLNGIYEFNYLTNGLLMKSIKSEQNEGNQSSHFFITESFGKPLFLAHLAIDTKNDIKKIYNQIEIAKTMLTEMANEIFVFNTISTISDQDFVKQLSNRYDNAIFKSIFN